MLEIDGFLGAEIELIGLKHQTASQKSLNPKYPGYKEKAPILSGPEYDVQ